MKALLNCKLIVGVLSILLMSACAPSQQPKATTETSLASVSKVNTDGISLSAPQYMMVSVPGRFALNAPAGVTVSSATWNFGDGTTVDGVAVDHALFDLGARTVTVTATSSLGTAMTFTQVVNVLSYSELLFCVSDLRISGPAEVTAGANADFSTSIPPCVAALQTGVSWDFGDGTTASGSAAASHTYANPGNYTATVTINYYYNDVARTFVLTTTVDVIAQTPPPTPTPNPDPTPTPNPDPTPTPDPGHCRLPEGALLGVGAISQRLIQIDGIYYLINGEQMTFYSTQYPENACSTVGQVRKCTDGILSGTNNYIYLLCNTPAPQTYSWVDTKAYTQCSADCGGVQTLIYECRSSSGSLADPSRCVGQAPVVTRVCDGNPAAVARTDVSSSQENGQPGLCPTGQVGSITSLRTVTTKTTYACIEHQVAVASTSTVYGDWAVTNTCQPKPQDPPPPTTPDDHCDHDGDSHKNDRGRGHHSHGNGNGYGHHKDCDPKPPKPDRDCDEHHGHHKDKDCDRHKHKDCDHGKKKYGRDCDHKRDNDHGNNNGHGKDRDDDRGHGGKDNSKGKDKDCDKDGKSGSHNSGGKNSRR